MEKSVQPEPGKSNGTSAYEPSDEAKLAGRIVDGEARTPWEAVSSKTTTEDLDVARTLIGEIVGACESGNRATLDAMRRALLALREFVRDPTEHAGRMIARCVEIVEVHDQAQRIYGRAAPSPLPALVELEPRFATVDPESFRSWIESANPPLYRSAALVVIANAWGLGSGDDPFEDKLTRAQARLRKERSKYGNPRELLAE